MAALKFVLPTLLLLLTVLMPRTQGAIQLQHLSTLYVPYSYLQASAPKVAVDSDSVEQVAFDATNMLAYVVGDDYMQIVDYADVKSPEIVYRHRVPRRGNDIAACGDYVAYLIQGSDSQEPGTLYIYNKYVRGTGQDPGTFTKVFEKTIGCNPEMLTFTSDCSTILTADEGTAGDDATETMFLNPEGKITLIRITGDPNDPFTTKNITFDSFNARREKYLNLGVRMPYDGYYNNFTEQTLSQSVEPEYIAINPRDNVAYINLQENNAIALLDLYTELITEIIPLGTKNWKNLQLDPSDRDDAIKFQTGYDIKSFYMPDAIKYFEIDGVGYIATADEGSDLDYYFRAPGRDRYWSDAKRGEDVHDEGLLASTVSDELRTALNDDLKLGRLEFSKTDGMSATEPGKIEELFFFGGRGFSILRASDMTRVFDSGDDIERLVAQYYPEVFNSETDPDKDDLNTESPPDLKDKRSDNRGPECEGIEVGTVNGQTVIFVGVDRASVVAIYTVDSSGQAQFQSLHRSGGTDRTFAQLLEDRNLGDLDPKDLDFIPAERSPTRKPMLLVSGATSGTLSMYEVVSGGDGPLPYGGHGVPTSSTSGVLVLLLSVLSLWLWM